MILEATHRTRYTYPSPARDSHNEVRLAPFTNDSQTCLEFSLRTSPAVEVFTYQSWSGQVHHFTAREPHMALEIVATTRVETLRPNPFESIDLLQNDWSFYQGDETKQGFAEFLGDSPYIHLTAGVAEVAGKPKKGESVPDFLLGLNSRINDLLTYEPDVTHVHSQIDEVLELKAGVCQDYAHLMVGCCRTLGIPARYVSGYLYGGAGIRGEQATHAWVECLLPDGMWMVLDPTNNILANDHHIRVHIGRDYSDAAPFRGVYVGPPSDGLEVSVSVVALASCPVG